jgi:hypothetical protein
MMTTELTACRVPKDPMSLAPVEGYVAAFVAFY